MTHKATKKRSNAAKLRLIPTCSQVRDWLTSTQMTKWLDANLQQPHHTDRILRAIAEQICRDGMRHDVTLRFEGYQVQVGVNVLRWQLWIRMSMTNVLTGEQGIYEPDCPFTLSKFLCSPEQRYRSFLP